jgi:2-amino-4-hydroxy-6-hydroxymethyldihydropteridine diphosphokinase
LKIILDEQNHLLFLPSFPKKFHQQKKRFEVIVGFGANIPNEIRRFQKLLHYLKANKYINLHASSPLLVNPPFGYFKQRRFYNGALHLSTNLPPLVFMRHLMHIEKHFGRKRSFANAPRKLDLDIIFYERALIRKKKLTIPHKSYHERESVLIPLAFLDV